MEAVFFELPLLLAGEPVEAIPFRHVGSIGWASRNRLRPRKQEREHVSLPASSMQPMGHNRPGRKPSRYNTGGTYKGHLGMEFLPTRVFDAVVSSG